ncbi:hypothetical protein K493DRAFT_317695 [Basidiobolus meristosporus CBS 931.73]|uniref:Uncharacterized protein n=1 Tax=Basidiobolus meristosporus CBS 931.73 TaxID=1314790 RepID=A0A1Y1XZP2_9FUNG|nr:hypothetical protein K493DRAFT_317695 [Basidiobolus meristosporus CBS 931.73]|eukprot:ORX90834.1 hypothetical protein K493DRAFT_317695 [Basidiobolus meristosporus CBS 931.73]
MFPVRNPLRIYPHLARVPARPLLVPRLYSGKPTRPADQKDWMDAEDGGYAQEAIRSISEETINIPGETVVESMGDRETVVEETTDAPSSLSPENIQKDWMSSDEDSEYAKEAIRVAKQETFSAPSDSNVQGVQAQSLGASKKHPSPPKQDWLDDEESGLVDEAVRAVENDTINVPGEAKVQRTSGGDS